MKEIEDIIKNTDENNVKKIDWTKAWGEKYPVLLTYEKLKDIDVYQQKISELYEEFQQQFKLSDTDTALILKDILYKKFKLVKRD